MNNWGKDRFEHFQIGHIFNNIVLDLGKITFNLFRKILFLSIWILRYQRILKGGFFKQNWDNFILVFLQGAEKLSSELQSLPPSL